MVKPLDTASSQMQTSSFGQSKGLCTTITGRSWKEAYAGLGISLLLTCNPAIQVSNSIENAVLKNVAPMLFTHLKICSLFQSYCKCSVDLVSGALSNLVAHAAHEW